MNKSKVASRLKPPTPSFRNRELPKEVSNETASTSALSSQNSVPQSRAAFGVAAKKRRSKSFGLATAKAKLNTRMKLAAQAQSTVAPARTVRAPAARVNTGLSVQARTAVKRPASVDTTKPAVSAPKLSKFDYKGRFALLEEKHKSLVKTSKDATETLEILEKENITLTSTCEEQSKLIEELMQYKVKTSDLVATLKETEEKFLKSEKNGQQLQEKLARKLQELANLHDNYNHLNDLFGQVKAEKASVETALSLQKDELQHAKATIEEYKNEIREHETQRRRLHNDVQDLKGNIRVFCRVRPLKPDEEDKMPCYMEFMDDSTLGLRKSRESMVAREKGDSKVEFTFDKVFPGEAQQAEVFEDLAQLVQSTLDGYNVCVFAYGQTGSGKTFTMLGDSNNLGMIPRSVELLFIRIEQMKKLGWQYEVQVNFIEIYNEAIKDLLNPDSKKPHEIKHNDGKGAVVTNLCTETVTSAMTLKKLMIKANSMRAMAATNFNLHSSRSHAVTKVSVCGSFEQTVFNGSLNLVDLAGSESAKTSERMAETKSINKSLSTLGTVMLALHNKDKHIPYRNSKLTYLLQSSLGGNSKTLMFVNISPLDDCYPETINSLRFASKVKEVKTGSKRNRLINKENKF